MIESGSNITGTGESRGSSIPPARFALAISWQSVQGGSHD